MITGELKSKIDKIWDTIWTGGISSPITVLEQITYLMFMKLLDDTETKKEDIINALNNIVTYSNEKSKNITEVDLYELGLIGKEDSKAKREKVCAVYHLGWCNAKTFLKRVNMFGLSVEQIKEVICE